MGPRQKYKYSELLSEIEADLEIEARDTTQETNISQETINALMMSNLQRMALLKQQTSGQA